MKQKTPQEKKVLSYSKDCRNDYGENDKSSRKNIPLHKARINRAYRSKINEVLKTGDGKINLAEAELIESEVKSIRKDKWKKSADISLGEFVEGHLEIRRNRTVKGKTARQQFNEIVNKFKFDITQKAENIWIAKIIGLEQFTAEAESRESAIEKVRYIAVAAIERECFREHRILVGRKYIEQMLAIE